VPLAKAIQGHGAAKSLLIEHTSFWRLRRIVCWQHEAEGRSRHKLPQRRRHDPRLYSGLKYNTDICETSLDAIFEVKDRTDSCLAFCLSVMYKRNQSMYSDCCPGANNANRTMAQLWFRSSSQSSMKITLAFLLRAFVRRSSSSAHVYTVFQKVTPKF